MGKVRKAGAWALLALDVAAAAATLLGYFHVGPESLNSFVAANSFWLLPAIAFVLGVSLGWIGRGAADAISEKSLVAKLSPAECAMIVDCLDAERSGGVLVTGWKDPVALSLAKSGVFADVGDNIGMKRSRFSLTPKWRKLAARHESALRDNS